MQKIKRRPADSFEIVVGDREQEESDAKGHQDDLDPSAPDLARGQKTTLLNALPIATADNFQGKEAFL